jgi:hypothetical protein
LIVELFEAHRQRHILDDQEQIDVVPCERERNVKEFDYEGEDKVVRHQIKDEAETGKGEEFPHVVVDDTAKDASLFDVVDLA